MKKLLMTAAAIATFVAVLPTTGSANLNVNLQIDGYLPAPPGVRIFLDAGRPYYLEDNRRVYVGKKRKHDNGKHRGQYKDHEDQGKKNGHGKNGKHD